MIDQGHGKEKRHESELPVLFDRKEQCCGCSACFAACPTNSVVMIPDEEGFLYPHVNSESCIRCYRCLAVCSFRKDRSGRAAL